MVFWAFFFLILFLSALVAYLGDRVAKWAGKRHFRLFRLRPRQTATLVAVLTGVGIALLSYLGFLLVVEEARTTILEAESVRKERDLLRREKAALGEALKAMKSEAARALAELNELREGRQFLAAALEASEGRRQALEAEIQGLRVRAQDLARLLAQREEDLKAKAEEAQALEARLGELRREVERLEEEKAQVLAAFRAAQTNLQTLRAQVQALEEARRSLSAELARTRQALELAQGQLSRLASEAAALGAQKQRLATNLALLARALDLGEVGLREGEGLEVVRLEAERRARLLGFQGVVLEGEASGPGVVFLEGRGYEEGRLRVALRFYPARRVAGLGEVLLSATFPVVEAQRRLEDLAKRVRAKLLEAGFPPAYLTFPSKEELARGLALLEGKGGVARVGVVALGELWTHERPLLAFALLGGPPGPEVPVPTREVR